MIDDYTVKLATEYLDYCFGKSEAADLPGMLNQVDYYDRVVMVLEEVNEALRLRPSVFVHRVEGRVIFNQRAGDRAITEDDLQRNFAIYHTDFWAKYKELDKHRE